MCIAVVFMVALGGVQANQCSNGGECPSDSKPEHVSSLLQTKLQMTVPEDGNRSKKNTATDDPMACAFRDVFEEADRRIFYELLEVFAKMSRRSKVTYSLAYGSLVSQQCVGDQFAWDDDGDLLVYDGWDSLGNLADGLDLYLFDEFKGKYRLAWDAAYGRTNMKLYSVEGRQKQGRQDTPWLAPFLDIAALSCSELTCTFMRGDSWMARHTTSSDKTTYNRDDIFPIEYGTFGHLKQPIPKRPSKILEARYNMTPCIKSVPLDFDHFLEIQRPKKVRNLFKDGVRTELVSRRLSDSICDHRSECN